MKCPKCGSVTTPDQHVICLACNIDMTEAKSEQKPEEPETSFRASVVKKPVSSVTKKA